MSVEEFISEWKSSIPYIRAHTSGSTGKPKEILLPKKLVSESALRSITHFDINAESRIHLCLSTDYIAGKMAVIRALLSGAMLTVEPPSSNPLANDVNKDKKITLLSVVAAQIHSLYLQKLNGTLTPVKHLLIGGASLTEHIAEESLKIGEHVWESYGMTETASHIALREIITPQDIITRPFSLLPGIEASADQRDCLVITMPDGQKLVTNDACRFSDKNRFFILGRKDNVIISGGLKVHPESVERILEPLMGKYSSYFITSIPDRKWGQSIILAVEGNEMEESEKASLLAGCKKLLPAHERPHDIICMPRFRRTESGKIIRKL